MLYAQACTVRNPDIFRDWEYQCPERRVKVVNGVHVDFAKSDNHDGIYSNARLYDDRHSARGVLGLFRCMMEGGLSATYQDIAILETPYTYAPETRNLRTTPCCSPR